MKVFVYTPTQTYSFGAIVVAAPTEQEARAIVDKTDPTLFYDCSELFGVEASGETRILHDSHGIA